VQVTFTEEPVIKMRAFGATVDFVAYVPPVLDSSEEEKIADWCRCWDLAG
jgi:hypothetical protein